MEEKFYVIGGEYQDTTFTTLVEGTQERHGPFTKQEAMEKWRSRTGWTVDNCMVRFSIIPAETEGQTAI